MLQEFREGQVPEQPINKQSEKDPNSVVTFIYRGNNPFMRALVLGARNNGLVVNSREISDEAYKEKGSDAKELLGEVSGIVVTDGTLSKLVAEVMPEEQTALNAYEALGGLDSAESIVRMALPVIEGIRKLGRIPVILNARLEDHTRYPLYRRFETSPDLREKYPQLKGKMGYVCESEYSAILRTEYNLPVIGNDEVYYETVARESFLPRDVIGNVLTSLDRRGLDPKQVIILADHHLRYLNSREIAKLGLNELEIALICPCCAGLRSIFDEQSYQSEIEKVGVSFLPLETESQIISATDDLLKMIEQKREELKH
jgi:hypothetical protein